MRGAAGTIIRRADGRARAKNSDPDGGKDLRKIKVQRFHSNNRRTRRTNTVADRIPIVVGRSVRAHRKSGAPDGGRRPLCRSRVKEGSAVAAPLIFTDKVASDFGASRKLILNSFGSAGGGIGFGFSRCLCRVLAQ